jgi:hypothetical protein
MAAAAVLLAQWAADLEPRPEDLALAGRSKCPRAAGLPPVRRRADGSQPTPAEIYRDGHASTQRAADQVTQRAAGSGPVVASRCAGRGGSGGSASATSICRVPSTLMAFRVTSRRLKIINCGVTALGDSWPARRPAGSMRDADGGGVAAAERAGREQVRLAAAE